jgi:Tol biopolymer transport system component
MAFTFTWVDYTKTHPFIASSKDIPSIRMGTLAVGSWGESDPGWPTAPDASKAKKFVTGLRVIGGSARDIKVWMDGPQGDLIYRSKKSEFSQDLLDRGFKFKIQLVGGARIVFVKDPAANSTSGTDIYSSNEEGRDERRELTNSTNDYQAAPDPDGTRFAFVSEREGDKRIFIRNSDGTVEPLTTPSGADDVSPNWSPNGQFVAFTRVFNDGTRQVFRIDVDTKEITQLTSTGVNHSPAYSPDSDRIAFLSSRQDNVDQVWVMYSDGSSQTRVSESKSREADVDWSTDSFIYFARRVGRWQVFRFHYDVPTGVASGEIALTGDNFNNKQPSVSPDGSRLVFVSDRDGNDNVYRMNSDGTGSVRLTSASENENNPAWSPEGVYLDTALDGVSRDIVLIDPDVPAEDRITHNGIQDFSLAWHPDAAYGITVSDRDGRDELWLVTPQLNNASTPLLFAEKIASHNGQCIDPSVRSDNVVAYSSNRNGGFDIYLTDSEGGIDERVTTDGTTNVQPSLSPNPADAWIAYSSARDGRQQIYKIRPDGSENTRLTNSVADDSSPSFSPDGERIAFVRRVGDRARVWVMNADGSAAAAISPDVAGEALDPSWNPDSNEIVYAHSGSTNRVYLIAADGSGSPLTIASSSSVITKPRFVPGRFLITYTRNNSGVRDVWLKSFGTEGYSPVASTIDNNSIFTHARMSPNQEKVLVHNETLGAKPIIPRFAPSLGLSSSAIPQECPTLVYDLSGSAKTRLTPDDTYGDRVLMRHPFQSSVYVYSSSRDGLFRRTSTVHEELVHDTPYPVVLSDLAGVSGDSARQWALFAAGHEVFTVQLVSGVVTKIGETENEEVATSVAFHPYAMPSSSYSPHLGMPFLYVAAGKVVERQPGGSYRRMLPTNTPNLDPDTIYGYHIARRGYDPAAAGVLKAQVLISYAVRTSLPGGAFRWDHRLDIAWLEDWSTSTSGANAAQILDSLNNGGTTCRFAYPQCVIPFSGTAQQGNNIFVWTREGVGSGVNRVVVKDENALHELPAGTRFGRHEPSLVGNTKAVNAAYGQNRANDSEIGSRIARFLGTSTYEPTAWMTNEPDYDLFATYSPDGSKIAAVSWRKFEENGPAHSRIYKMNSDGTGRQLVVEFGSDLRHLDWGANDYIAYTHNLPYTNAQGLSAQTRGLRMVKEDGTEDQMVADPFVESNQNWAGRPFELQFPRFSPDGTKLAYVRKYTRNWFGEETPFVTVVIRELSTGQQTLIYTHRFTSATGLAWMGSSALSFGANIDWLGNGVQQPYILRLDIPTSGPNNTLVSGPSGQVMRAFDMLGASNLYVLSTTESLSLLKGVLDGGVNRNASQNANDDTQPRWGVGAVDGPGWYFVNNSSGRGQLYRMDPDGSNIVQIRDSGVSETQPVVSPDGNKLAFVAVAGGRQHIHVSDISGGVAAIGEPVKISTGNSDNFDPSWSDDSSTIYFASRRSGYEKIYQVDASGGVETLLSIGNLPERWPQVKGSKMAFSRRIDGNWRIYITDFSLQTTTELGDVAGSQHEPTWSPDGTRIAYSSNSSGRRQVYSIGLDGSGRIRHTQSASVDSQPSYNGDGTRIAFATNRDMQSEIYLALATGSGGESLTHNFVNDFSPAFSYDGTRIVFVSDRSGDDQIHRFTIGSAYSAKLTSDGENTDPSFTPDDNQIVFASNRGDGSWQIFRMDADGDNQEQVESAPTGDNRRPWCSPNGGKIVFDTDRGGNRQVAVVNSDGTGFTQLTSGAHECMEPKFSPDGIRIAFTRVIEGVDQVWIMDSNGANQVQLTNVSMRCSAPAWSPNGQYIIYTRWVSGGGREVWKISIDGSDDQRVIEFGHSPEFSTTQSSTSAFLAHPSTWIDLPTSENEAFPIGNAIAAKNGEAFSPKFAVAVYAPEEETDAAVRSVRLLASFDASHS